jgi:signal recognition particle receptor subunit beta
MFFVWSQKRINVKLAYWGSTNVGKTTAVHALAGQISQRAPEEAARAEADGIGAVGMRRNVQPVEIDEPEVRFTTYFCHPPAEIGEFSGYPLHYQCKTAEQPLEGNDALEKVLDGICGVVLVADASPERQPANEEALRDLVARLSSRHDVTASATTSLVEQLFGTDGPLRLVLQVNKIDLDAAIDAGAVRRGLMLPDWVQVVATVATDGEGVYEAFEAIGEELRPLLEEAQDRGRIPAGEEPGEHGAQS